jgi:hypothetical protein
LLSMSSKTRAMPSASFCFHYILVGFHGFAHGFDYDVKDTQRGKDNCKKCFGENLISYTKQRICVHMRWYRHNNSRSEIVKLLELHTGKSLKTLDLEMNTWTPKAQQSIGTRNKNRQREV